MDLKSRLDWVDIAKGISILLVVMLYATNGAGEATQNTGALHYLIGFATPFRMPEFFLISGLFLANVINRPWARFADRRVLHYFYFYALWAIIHIGLKVGIAGANPALAGQYILWAIIQPYGVLWFIYVLALTSIAAKILFELRVPHWITLLGAAVLNMAQIHTGSYALDQFTAYFFFFYAGYAFAPFIFKLVTNAINAPALGWSTLAIWAGLNFYLVFTPGFKAEPTQFTMGLAEMPLLRLILALVGSVAICLLAGLLTRHRWAQALNFIGKHSLVIYVGFVLPLGFSRLALVKLGLITDTSVLSIVTMAIAVGVTLVGYGLVQTTGLGRFLFQRPQWATIAETRLKSDRSIKISAPAE